ncbi:MAG: hypothetical protein LBT67_00210 [Holosporaceae bacterium]|jgi:hypothetical protein|nr:hypothetical protein [Holosporaceae bacterium]
MRALVSLNYLGQKIKLAVMDVAQPKTLVLKDLLRKPFLRFGGAGKDVILTKFLYN